MAEELRKPLRFTTQKDFTYRLVLSTLTGRAIQISEIRPDSTNPGLAPHEISFLRLLEAVTNGSDINISMTGTTLRYRPGLITGSAPGSGAAGGVLTHEVPAGCGRGISYFLIPLCLLAPFSKAPINVLFKGPGVITSATPSGDMSTDSVRTGILPYYEQFGINRNSLELRTWTRSNPGPSGRDGAGVVQLIFGHQVRLPKTLHLLNAGKIKKIEGIAYSIGVSASNNARMIDAAKGVLNPLRANCMIHSDFSHAPFLPGHDHNKPKGKTKTGLGFGLALVAESSLGSRYTADVASPPSGGETPEDIGLSCAYQLLDNISLGGVVPPSAAPTVLTLMVMGSEDVGRIQLGKYVLGSEDIVSLARDMSKFGTSQWGIRDAPEGDGSEVIVSIVGKGVGNVGRKIA